MLIYISEVLETPVSTLLGQTVTEQKADDLKAISEKLEIINVQLAQRKTARRKLLHWLLISVCVVIVAIFAVLGIINSPYLGWNYSDPETAVLGVAFHAFEWLFVRLAPIIFIRAVVGVFLNTQESVEQIYFRNMVCIYMLGREYNYTRSSHCYFRIFYSGT